MKQALATSIVVRTFAAALLFEAALALMVCSRKWSWLKVARHRGMKRAIIAVARRLAVILHRMWVDGTEFRWTREQAVAA